MVAWMGSGGRGTQVRVSEGVVGVGSGGVARVLNGGGGPRLQACRIVDVARAGSCGLRATHDVGAMGKTRSPSPSPSPSLSRPWAEVRNGTGGHDRPSDRAPAPSSLRSPHPSMRSRCRCTPPRPDAGDSTRGVRRSCSTSSPCGVTRIAWKIRRLDLASVIRALLERRSASVPGADYLENTRTHSARKN